MKIEHIFEYLYVKPAKCFRFWNSFVSYLLITMLSCLALFAYESSAQTCIPPAVGVPFASGPPIWWDPAQDPTHNPADPNSGIYNRIDDPRWKTASSITHGNGATEHVSLRALHHTSGGAQSVYLSWWIKVAPVFGTNNDLLYIGLKPNGSATGLLLRMTLTTAGAQDTSDYALDVSAVADDGSFGAPLDPDPAWTNNIRVWANQPVPNTWAIHVNVPIGTDLGTGDILGTDFNMWYEVLQGTLTAPIIEYTWPREADFAVSTVAFVETLPAPSTWPGFHLSSGTSDPLCATGGITIDVVDIGTEHPDGPGKISTINMNTFYARPTNKTGDPVDVGKVHARFRLANWGIQPDPNEVADPNQLWTEVRGLGNVTQSSPPDTIADGAHWNITGTWLPDNGIPEEAGWFDGTRWTHQCMLVELSGSDLEFLRSSIHRNMNFVAASKFEEEAQVSVVGLTPINPSDRDVYLYVETKNMPERVKDSDLYHRKVATTIDPRKVSTFFNKDDERPKVEQIADRMPTYVIHGYYDTGRTITVNEKSHPILRPMTSLGYFVTHEGKVDGWSHNLQGAEEIAPNFYKIAVPNNDTATITTTVKALQPSSFRRCFDWMQPKP